MVLPYWLILAALATEIMAAVVGFGSSTILTPVAALTFDVKTALVLVAIFHTSGAIVRLLRFRPNLDRSFLVKFGGPTVMATLLGAVLTAGISSNFLVVLLGMFLVFVVIYEWARPAFSLPRTGANEVAGGLLTGFASGFFGAGGAIRAAALQAFGMKKEEYAGSSAAIAVLSDLTRIPVYVASGYLVGVPLVWLPGLIVLGILGSIIGLAIIDNIPQKSFRTIVLIAIFVVSVKLIIDGIAG